MSPLQEYSGTVQVSSRPDIHIFYRSTHAIPIPATKPVILLSNSLAATTSLWDLFVAEFASTHAILRYDARFHGNSPLAEGDYDYEAGHTLETLAEDVAVLLRHLGVARSAKAFIGLSIGASVGVVLAAKHPDLFERFLIVGTKARKGGAGDDAAYDARIAAIREGGAAAQARQSVERWFGASWIRENPVKAGEVADMVAGLRLEGFLASVAALRKLDLWPYADAIGRRGEGAKVVFVAGENDSRAVVGETKQLAERAGSECVLVEGAGHIVNIEQPSRFHDIVRRALQ